MTEIDVRVGSNVAELRQRASLSVRDLASAIGLSETDLASAEAGSYRLKADQLFKISRALKAPIGKILGESGPSSTEGVGH